MYLQKLAPILALFFITACSNNCDSNQATNKMLALGKVQGRLMSDGGEATANFASQLAIESGAVSELIAQQKYNEACAKANEIAAKYEIDLDKEQKDMITIEQLAKDGGKGSGTCSIGDAAKKQMELHGLLQKEVDAGRMTSEVFRQFNDDTKSFAELLSTNPSKACELIDNLKVKYKL